MLVWVFRNIRKNYHAKLSEFHGKSRENVIEWCEEVKRVAIVNNWKDICIYTIVAAYLREAAANYYEKMKGTVR